MMGGYGRGYGYDMMGGGWFGGLLMLVFFALIVGGVVLLIVWAARLSGGGHGVPSGGMTSPGSAGHDEAVAIAKKRLASGEITSEQYEEIMRSLGG